MCFATTRTLARLSRNLQFRSAIVSATATATTKYAAAPPSHSPPLWLWFAPAVLRPQTSNLPRGCGCFHSTTEPHREPTIFALSTPPGRSAIAVIRISGPRCRDVCKSLTFSPTLPKPRIASLRRIYSPTSHEILDPGALILFFPSPHSLTGEDILELHVHGSPAIVRAVLSTLGSISPATIRPALAGEFTRRAFYNSRLSLPEIEALGDTLSAQTESQRKRAVSGASRELSERYENWRKKLVDARGELEALIDFSEDQHFDQSNTELLGNVVSEVRGLKKRLETHARNAVRGELLRSGISLSLVGAPNAGKSSLLNRIVGREAAIVSEEAGTTRDVVDLAIDIGGFMVLLGDTAGLRVDATGKVVGKIESEGIRRARERAGAANVVVAVLDVEPGRSVRIAEEVVAVLKEASEMGKEVVVAVNKIDLLDLRDHSLPPSVVDTILTTLPNVTTSRIHGVSCTANTGIQPLLESLTDVFTALTSPTSTDAAISPEELHGAISATERQRVLVERCIESLEKFLEMTARGGAGRERRGEGDGEVNVVLAAEELRDAARSLGEITGRGEAGDVEEVLGVVFERFCVGK